MRKQYAVVGCGNVGLKVIGLLGSRGVKEALVADTSGIYRTNDLRLLASMKEKENKASELQPDKARKRISDFEAVMKETIMRIGPANEETISESCKGRMVITALPTGPGTGPGTAASLNLAALRTASFCIAVDKSHAYKEAYGMLRSHMANGKYAPIGAILAPCQAWDLIDGLGIAGAEGIVNGTTNYIIWSMTNGATFEQALREAGERGYADPHRSGMGFGDLVGLDASVKMMALARMQNPNNAGEIPVFLKIGAKAYRVNGGERFEDAQTGEPVEGSRLYEEVKRELLRIPSLLKRGETLRQVASTGHDGSVAVSLDAMDSRSCERLTGTLNRLSIRIASGKFDPGRIMQIYDSAKIDGGRASCSLSSDGISWEVRLEWNGRKLSIEGPGTGPLQTATALVSACERRAAGQESG